MSREYARNRIGKKTFVAYFNFRISKKTFFQLHFGDRLGRLALRRPCKGALTSRRDSRKRRPDDRPTDRRPFERF